MKKKSSHSAVIKSPGRWTGNNIFFKGGLRSVQDIFYLDRIFAYYSIAIGYWPEGKSSFSTPPIRGGKGNIEGIDFIKGTQHAAQWSNESKYSKLKFFLEIQLVRPTKVCGSIK